MKNSNVLSISVENAWKPLPVSEWNEENARHLLNRAGWTATPEMLKLAVSEGLGKTLNRLFSLGAMSKGIIKPPSVVRFENEEKELQASLRGATSPEERAKIRREIQNKERNGINDLAMQWIKDAAEIENSAFYKWVLFLSDVYVVGADKVRNPTFIHQHFQIIAKNAYITAPSLTKEISRSPAMIQYLDLNRSDKKAPNENFARELFELFVLGEGNYNENDIKESAKAFTGYRTKGGDFFINNQQRDMGIKSIFENTGRFSGDDVIDIAYKQPSAGRFLPQEMIKFYLTDTEIPIQYLDEIAKIWRSKNYSLRTLLGLFFGSNIFYSKEYKRNYIKSPIHFYCGLVQDMGIKVSPLQRLVTQPLRSMGQMPFYPPNVRGWVGGTNWINSSTIQARRQTVENLFATIDEKTLNADEQKQLSLAKENGTYEFVFNEKSLAELSKLSNKEASFVLCHRFINNPSREILHGIERFLGTPTLKGKKDSGTPTTRLKRAIVTILQSPEYQLC
jgi:uncharacterized protein (DUF1800 family)